MGTCRQSENLFYSLKNKEYKRFWYLVTHFSKLTYEDTFMPIVCKIIGHKPYLPEKMEGNEFACKRCHRYIDSSKLDPIKYCETYKTIGCSHIDGISCDLSKCNFSNPVQIKCNSGKGIGCNYIYNEGDECDNKVEVTLRDIRFTGYDIVYVFDYLNSSGSGSTIYPKKLVPLYNTKLFKVLSQDDLIKKYNENEISKK